MYRGERTKLPASGNQPLPPNPRGSHPAAFAESEGWPRLHETLHETRLREIRLRCSVCWDEGPFELEADQREQLRTTGYLELPCRYCRLARAWEAVNPAELAPKPAEPETGVRKILLVDDDPASLELLQSICGAWEAQIDVAQNGEEGMRKLAENRYDLLISEMRLSDMPAEEFLKFIGENLILAPDQIVLIGDESQGTVRQFIALSGCGYCRKPLQFTQLLQEVEGRFSGSESGESPESTTTSVIL